MEIYLDGNETMVVSLFMWYNILLVKPQIGRDNPLLVIGKCCGASWWLVT